jgi:hypothetical protein
MGERSGSKAKTTRAALFVLAFQLPVTDDPDHTQSYMITIQNINKRFCCGNIVIICFFYLLTSGCTYTQKLSTMLEKRHTYDADLATLKRGNKEFQAGNYQKALEIYSILSQLAKNKTTQRKALYGLACTKLVLSKNQTDLNESIILWDAWSQTVPQEISAEDPRMLRPILVEKSTTSIPKKQIIIKESSAENKINTEIIRSQNNDIKKLQSLLNIKKKEIEKLKNQISSIEAIDQDILQKKKEISTQ